MQEGGWDLSGEDPGQRQRELATDCVESTISCCGQHFFSGAAEDADCVCVWVGSAPKRFAVGLSL